MFTRRHFLALTGASALQACSSGGSVPAATKTATTAFRPVPNAAFDRWIDGFRSRASASGISDATLRLGLRGVGFLPEVIERDRNQTEFKRSFEDYLAIVASEEKIKAGRIAFAQQRSRLDACLLYTSPSPRDRG